jgi:hypothetical protein
MPRKVLPGGRCRFHANGAVNAQAFRRERLLALFVQGDSDPVWRGIGNPAAGSTRESSSGASLLDVAEGTGNRAPAAAQRSTSAGVRTAWRRLFDWPGKR